MVFFNATGWMGEAITHSVEASTGSLFITLLLIMVGLIALFAALNVSLEWTAIFIVPLCVGLMAEYSVFLAPGGALLIYLAILLVKWLPWS